MQFSSTKDCTDQGTAYLYRIRQHIFDWIGFTNLCISLLFQKLWPVVEVTISMWKDYAKVREKVGSWDAFIYANEYAIDLSNKYLCVCLFSHIYVMK